MEFLSFFSVPYNRLGGFYAKAAGRTVLLSLKNYKDRGQCAIKSAP
jgi:hypothetical protein